MMVDTLAAILRPGRAPIDQKGPKPLSRQPFEQRIARREIEEMLEQQVNLKLFVKVRPDWRDNAMLLKEYGYLAPKKK